MKKPISPQRQASQTTNAQHSQGPRTDTGKAHSSQNSVRHGLAAKKFCVPRADLEEFERFCAETIRSLDPVGFEEEKLARAIALDEFRLDRGRSMEGEIFLLNIGEGMDRDVWLTHGKNISLLSTYMARIQKLLRENKAELAAKQAARKAAEAETAEAEAAKA